MIDGSSADHSLSTITARGCRPCSLTALSEARISQEAPSVICELLPAVTFPHGRSKAGLSSPSFLDRGVRAYAVIKVVSFAVAPERRLELAGKPSFLLRTGEPLLALDRVAVGLRARHARRGARGFPAVCPHVEIDQRIGQPALQADDGVRNDGRKPRTATSRDQAVARAEDARNTNPPRCGER